MLEKNCIVLQGFVNLTPITSPVNQVYQAYHTGALRSALPGHTSFEAATQVLRGFGDTLKNSGRNGRNDRILEISI